MAYPLKDYQTNIISEPGSYIYTATTTGPMFASMQASINPSSLLIMSITQSGSTSASVTSNSTQALQQSHIEIQKLFNAVSGDVFTFAVSDSALANTVKIIAKINPGTC